MRLILLSLALSMLIVPPAMAHSMAAGPQYRKMVEQVLTYIPEGYDFGPMRTMYTQTKFYEPIGEELREQMVEYAYTAQNDPDIEKRKKALIDYHTIVQTHMGNMNVLKQAISLANQSRRFGDPKTLLAVYNGFVKALLYSGNGSRLNRAYDVLTMAEETVLMVELGLRILETEYRSLGARRYNMHLVENVETQELKTLFVDISIPMKHLENHGKIQTKYNTKGLNFKGSKN